MNSKRCADISPKNNTVHFHKTILTELLIIQFKIVKMNESKALVDIHNCGQNSMILMCKNSTVSNEFVI